MQRSQRAVISFCDSFTARYVRRELVRRQDSTSHAGTRQLATLRTNRDQMLRDKRLIPG